MFISRRFRRYIVLVVVLCLLLVPFPANNLWWREAFNCGHTVLFVILSFVVFRQIKAAYHFSNSFTIYLIVLLLGVLFGALTELLQNFVLRNASLNDFYRDVFGLVAGLGLVTVYGLKKNRYRKLVAAVLLIVSGGLIVHNISPLIQLSWHYLEKHRAFPVLVDFDAGWSESFVRFNRGEYPGIAVIEPESDWSSYHLLCINLRSNNKNNVLLTVRVHDAKHNQDFSDRFNIKLQMRPGLNKIEIPLDQVMRGPDHRELDLENIAGIGLFVRKQDNFDRLEIERFFLE